MWNYTIAAINAAKATQPTHGNIHKVDAAGVAAVSAGIDPVAMH